MQQTSSAHVRFQDSGVGTVKTATLEPTEPKENPRQKGATAAQRIHVKIVGDDIQTMLVANNLKIMLQKSSSLYWPMLRSFIQSRQIENGLVYNNNFQIKICNGAE